MALMMLHYRNTQRAQRPCRRARVRGCAVTWAVLMPAALACLPGCFVGQFERAASRPVGIDPARPYAGAWEGEARGVNGAFRVRVILAGKSFEAMALVAGAARLLSLSPAGRQPLDLG